MRLFQINSFCKNFFNNACISPKTEYNYESFSLIIAEGGQMDKSSAVPEAEVSKRNFVMLDQNKRLYSDALFLHGDEVFIQHRGEQYRLRRTRNGKLILTK
jgi:hemin uptake protein HemP